MLLVESSKTTSEASPNAIGGADAAAAARHQASTNRLKVMRTPANGRARVNLRVATGLPRLRNSRDIPASIIHGATYVTKWCQPCGGCPWGVPEHRESRPRGTASRTPADNTKNFETFPEKFHDSKQKHFIIVSIIQHGFRGEETDLVYMPRPIIPRHLQYRRNAELRRVYILYRDDVVDSTQQSRIVRRRDLHRGKPKGLNSRRYCSRREDSGAPASLTWNGS